MHLTAARRDELIAAVAAALQQRAGGPLGEVLLWLLPAVGPLTWLVGQVLWLAQPALAGWVDPARLAEYALLLEEPDIGDRLAAQLAGGRRPASAVNGFGNGHRTPVSARNRGSGRSSVTGVKETLADSGERR